MTLTNTEYEVSASRHDQFVSSTKNTELQRSASSINKEKLSQFPQWKRIAKEVFYVIRIAHIHVSHLFKQLPFLTA